MNLVCQLAKSQIESNRELTYQSLILINYLHIAWTDICEAGMSCNIVPEIFERLTLDETRFTRIICVRVDMIPDAV